MWADPARWYLVPWAVLAVLVGTALIALQPDRRRFDLFTPLAFAGWSHVLPAYGIGALVLSAGWRSPVIFLLPEPDDALSYTMAFALLGFAALAMGFLAPWGRRAGTALARRLPSRQWAPGEVLVPALLMLVTGTAVAATALDLGLLGYQRTDTVGPFDAALAIGAATTTTTSLALLGLVAFSTAAPGIRALALSAVLARAASDLLLSGSRGVLLSYAFVMAAAYACSGRTIRWRNVATLGAAFGVAIIVGMAYGSTFRALKGTEAVVGLSDTAGAVGSAAAATLARGVGGNIGFVIDRVVERVEIISNAAVVVARYQRLEPFEDAYGLRDNITRSLAASLVPRALWPNKPAASDARAFGELYFGYRNSFAVTSAADLLRNYGPIGVIVGMAALGVLLRLIYAALVESQPPSTWRLAAYITLLVTVSYEGFFGSIVPMLLRTAAVCAVCLVGVEVLRRIFVFVGRVRRPQIETPADARG